MGLETLQNKVMGRLFFFHIVCWFCLPKKKKIELLEYELSSFNKYLIFSPKYSLENSPLHEN